MGVQVTVRRVATIPDEIRLERYRRNPELGPRILFFSGGTALRGLSQCLIQYTHNSIHLVTPFDSGGSSAKLRDAFCMPSVGDLRNRLMSLSDHSTHGNGSVFNLFSHRLPMDMEDDDLGRVLQDMVKGEHELVQAIPDPMRKIVRNHLKYFVQAMPPGFDLRGANIGNLILTGGLVNNGGRLDPVIYLFTKLVEARGVVRLITNRDLTLCAELDNGSFLIGQHLFGGGDEGALPAPIRDVCLLAKKTRFERAEVQIRDKIREYISSADLICYPMGSFYSSLIANLLPRGVSEAIAENPCPKLYIPNTGQDPEQLGLSLAGCVDRLLRYLTRDTREMPVERILNFALLDTDGERYPDPRSAAAVEAMGIGLIESELVTEASAPYLDANRLADALLSLV